MVIFANFLYFGPNANIHEYSRQYRVKQQEDKDILALSARMLLASQAEK